MSEIVEKTVRTTNFTINALVSTFSYEISFLCISSSLLVIFSACFDPQIEEFVTRPYQQAIIDICIQRNSIVYLPTGAGKSYIAIQVIKHFSQDLET